MIFDIIYTIILFFSTFFLVLHIHLWLEYKDKIHLKGTSNILSTISLIIPAYNEEENIGKTLEKLKHLDYPKDKLEIIVVDDGSTDSTLKIAKKKAREFGKRMRVFTKKNSGKASALNFGTRKAKGQYVAVLDADSFFEKDALKRCVRYFDNDKIAAVTSHVLCSRRNSFWERMQNIELMIISFTRKLEEYINIIWVTPGPLSIYKKDVLKKIGGFDEKILVEDVEVAWRIHKRGYKVRMAFDAFSYSLYPTSLSRWWKQRLRWAVGGIQTLLKYKSSIKDRSTPVGSFFVPTAFIGYSSTIIAIGIFLYLFSIGAFEFLTYTFRSYSLGLNPFNRIELYYYLDYKIILGLVTLFLSIPLFKISLGLHKKMVKWRDIPIFLFIYPILYSFVNLHAIYKYIRGETGWLTK
jgi:cellulose synthase/poly-beta-1,6-N-acetylglucosamine synthase-like glycosyltransferase